MDRFAWDGLQPGTAVALHVAPDLHLVDGHVLSVHGSGRRREVGVRLADGSARWPMPGDVHVLPRTDGGDPCWRCAAASPTDPSTPKASHPTR